ncbi:hypothetical protein C2E23DRAFT_743716, partial [Lenzites betulinus]
AGPFAIPLTPNVALSTSFSRLNIRLKAWGYREDRAQFIAQYDAKRRCATVDQEAHETWVQLQDSWVVEGDAILDEVERLLGEGALQGLAHAEGLQVWQNVTSVVFKVQWIMAAVEARLDAP